VRAVPADQERFAEAIEAYRATARLGVPTDRVRIRAYLLAPLAIQLGVETPQFGLQPAIAVDLPGARAGFIVPVDVDAPDDFGSTAHYKCQAIAALMSIAYGRAFVAPRDPYMVGKDQLNAQQATELAIQHNVLIAGPGYQNPRLASAYEATLAARLVTLVDALELLDTPRFTQVMQAIRLHHLGLLARRMDFELGFSLIVASLEAMAQIAIARDQIPAVSYSPEELVIKEFCEAKAGKIGGWFKSKVRDQGRLKARFIEYVFRFAPVDSWTEQRHPLSETMEYLDEVSGSQAGGRDWVTRKSRDEVYPEDLSVEELRAIIASTYEDRSGFLHAGTRSTHASPQSYNRYFDAVDVYDYDFRAATRGRRFVATFDTLSTISRIALMRFLKETSDSIDPRSA
jgi:hypothetical protein